MIEVKAVTDVKILEGLKNEYLAGTTSPLDGMWLNGFLPMSHHFEICADAELIGYCCINDDGFVLQFYVQDGGNHSGAAILTGLIRQEFDQVPPVGGAFVSTAEPSYLSYCFDCFESFEVNALMYQFDGATPESPDQFPGVTLQGLRQDQLSEVVEFASNAIGAPVGWLEQYYSNLILREELFGCWRDGELVGTGEHRIREGVQAGFSDVGMIVGQQHRGRGLATSILKLLAQMAVNRGLSPICSTERENIAAQKAIARSGFVSRNRIIQFNV